MNSKLHILTKNNRLEAINIDASFLKDGNQYTIKTMIKQYDGFLLLFNQETNKGSVYEFASLSKDENPQIKFLLDHYNLKLDWDTIFDPSTLSNSSEITIQSIEDLIDEAKQ